MAFIDSGVKAQIPLPSLLESDVVDFTLVPNSPLVAVLSSTAVVLLHKTTLLPLGHHERSPQSIQTHGRNVAIKTKHMGRALHSHVNVFVQTDQGFLVIYQIHISNEAAVYQVHDAVDDRMIQSAQPFLTRRFKLTLTSLFKSASNMIASSGLFIMPSLVNNEHINNAFLVDNSLEGDIPLVKQFSIYKMVKITRMEDFFLPHHHNVVVRLGREGEINDENNMNENNMNENNMNENNMNENNMNENNTNEMNDMNDSNQNDSNGNSTPRIQSVSHEDTNDTKDTLVVVNMKTFESETFSAGPITFMAYNRFKGFFVFSDGESVWTRNKIHEENHRVGSVKGIRNISFNPKNDLVLVCSSSVELYALSEEKMVHLKGISETPCACTWAGSGDFFVLVDPSGKWELRSKFGFVLFESSMFSGAYATARSVKIADNSLALYVLGTDSHLYTLSLRRQVEGAIVGSRIEMEESLPILSNFANSIEYDTEGLCITKSKNNQVAITHGQNFAISTPSDNHVLWFVFKGDLENSTITKHFWFNDYVVLVSRTHDDLYDEVRIVNAKKSKYGMGGDVFTFDNEAIVWRYNFHKKRFVNCQYVENEGFLILTQDMKLIILELSTEELAEDIGHTKTYDLYIRLHKVIHMESMADSLPVDKVIQMSMFSRKHFVFLLNTGELLIMRSTEKSNNNFNSFSLDTLGEHVQSFGLVHSTQTFLYFVSRFGDLWVYDTAFSQPIVIPFEQGQVVSLTSSFEVIYQETRVVDGFVMQKSSRELVLNKVIQHYLVKDQEKVPLFKDQPHYKYALEVLLFTFLNEEKDDLLRRLVAFIDNDIIIRCLRKIDLGHWEKFFSVLNTNSTELMGDLISSGNVEHCYHFLIVYLNSKEDSGLNEEDRRLIVRIVRMLGEGGRWRWCAELCRFVGMMDENILEEIIEFSERE